MNARCGLRVKQQIASLGLRYAARVSHFGQMLRIAVKDAGFANVKAFALAVEMDQSFMSRVSRGARTPPLHAIERWADSLGLTGEARDDFIFLGHLEHAPDKIRESVTALRMKVLKYSLENVDIQADLTDARAELADARSKLLDLQGQLAVLAALARKKGIEIPEGFGDV